MINKTLTPVKDCAFIKNFSRNGKNMFSFRFKKNFMIHIFLSFTIEYLEIMLWGKSDPRGIVATYFVLSFVELLLSYFIFIKY